MAEKPTTAMKVLQFLGGLYLVLAFLGCAVLFLSIYYGEVPLWITNWGKRETYNETSTLYATVYFFCYWAYYTTPFLYTFIKSKDLFVTVRDGVLSPSNRAEHYFGKDNMRLKLSFGVGAIVLLLTYPTIGATHSIMNTILPPPYYVLTLPLGIYACVMINRGFKARAYRRELKKDCLDCSFFKITEDEGDDYASGYCCASERRSKGEGLWIHKQPIVRNTNGVGCHWFEYGHAEDYKEVME